MLVMVRVINPDGFGLVAMATTVLGLATLIGELGMTSALIQRAELEEAHKDSAFWTSICIGLALFAAFVLWAPALGRFYGEERLPPVLIVAAVPLVLGPLCSTHAALLRRNLKFERVARVEAIKSGISGVVMVFAALAGLGYWSILLGPIAGQVVAIVGYYLVTEGWRPGFRGSLAHARQLLSFSLYVAGGGAVNFVSANVDYLVVGRVLGPSALGVYTLAYQFVTVPLTRISALFSQVMFPAFSSLRDAPDAQRDAYVVITRSVALITFPVLAWGFVTAPELLSIVCGPEWLDAVPLIRALSVAGALKSVGTLVGVVFRAKGKASVELYWNLVWAAAVTLGVTVSVAWGSVGVATTISALSVPGVLYTEWLACKYLGLPVRRLLRALTLPSLGAAAALVAGMAARSFLAEPATLGAALRLLLLSCITLGSAWLGMWLAHPGLPSEARAFVRYFRGQGQWRS